MGLTSSKQEESPNETLSKLNDTVAMIEKRENKLQKDIDVLEEEAKRLLRGGNKNGALTTLKRKKQIVQQLERLSAQKLNVESISMKIEQAIMDAEVVKAQRYGSEALKSAYGGLTIEDIDKQLGEVQEQLDSANEISNALAKPLQPEEDLDDEFDDELKELEDEMKEEEKKDVASKVDQQHEHKLSEEDEDLLKELEEKISPSEHNPDDQLKELEATLDYA